MINKTYAQIRATHPLVLVLSVIAILLLAMMAFHLFFAGDASAAGTYWDCRRSNPWGHATTSSYSSYAWYVSQGWTCYRVGQIYG